MDNIFNYYFGFEFPPPSMASATEQDADVLNKSSLQHTLVLHAQLPTVALSMHRVYHIVVPKSLVSESLQAPSALERRQEQEEMELCEQIAGILARGVPRAYLASAIHENPMLTTGCKRIFREWIDVAALRLTSEECPTKVIRLGERHEGSSGGE